MRFTLRSAISAVILGAATLFMPNVGGVANAQITLGADFDHTKFKLSQKGYTRINLVGQGFTKFHVEACLNGIRYWFKADLRGNINQRRQIGTCAPERPLLDERQVRDIMRSVGFSRIEIEQVANVNVAIGCLGNEQYRVQIDQRGNVVNRQLIGNCRRSVATKDIRNSLRRDGFSQIKFINKRPPIYVVEACRDGRKFRIETNEFGDRVSRDRIGSCRRSLDPGNLATYLQNQGFNRIRILNDQPPKYIAEVCDQDERMEIALNRFGDIVDRFRIGRCARKISARQLVRNMRDQGFVRINIRRETKRGYIADACHSGKLYRNVYDHYGAIEDERHRGPCPSFTVQQVRKQLADRDFKRLGVFVEGCRKGKRVRFELNELGDRVNREIIGNCR